MEEKLLGVAQHFYVHVEKRSLPLEASKALVNCYLGKCPRNLALSLLTRTKKHLSLWIGDSSQIQIYKRFFGHLSKKEDLKLAECFSPFVLVGAWESFYEVFIKERSERRRAFSNLKSFFEELEVEGILREANPKVLFNSLLRMLDIPEDHSFYVATHMAYMINPHAFIPLSRSTGKAISVEEPESYFRLIESTREKRIKPIEVSALLHMLYESVPSKRLGVEQVLGIDRERELLKKAEYLWNQERFYDAHEILEEVWEFVKDAEKRECYQGIVRFAIALHHLQNGDTKKAENVLRKALPQMKGCKVRIPVDLKDLSSYAEDILHSLKKKEQPKVCPPFRVI